MKKILTIIALTLIIQTASKAQGNLQFNQVLSYTGNVYNYGNYSASPVWTVPSGKVWKIESYTRDFLMINNISINGNTITGNNIWLKSGDILQCNPTSYSTGYNYLFSIIEFNIIP
jgi:hypothetical protein